MSDSYEIADDGRMWTWERTAKARQQIAALVALGWAAHAGREPGEVVIEDVQRFIAPIGTAPNVSGLPLGEEWQELGHVADGGSFSYGEADWDAERALRESVRWANVPRCHTFKVLSADVDKLREHIENNPPITEEES